MAVNYRNVFANIGLVFLIATAACGGDDEVGVIDEDSARRAYLGLDTAVERAMNLGFDGYNQASNANIPEQSANGDQNGTMVVEGKVDQGASNNKQMDLTVSLTDYADDPVEKVNIQYATGDQPLQLGLSLKGLPNATFTGSFIGSPTMTGGLEGTVTLDLNLSGETEETASGDGSVQRKEGTLRITGTATSAFGSYAVDISR